MCGSIPPMTGYHSSGKEAGPILKVIGGLILVMLFVFTLIADCIKKGS